jgi:hypothetical protein
MECCQCVGGQHTMSHDFGETKLFQRRRSMKKRLSIFLITVALIAGMVGCGGGGVEYDLTIASTAGGSVITPGERTFTYVKGEMVNLVAEAEEGYQFVSWSGDVDTIGNVEDAATTITMNDDYSITADFAVNQYDLTISSTDGGSVTIPGEGTSTYDYDTVVDLVAPPDNGYQFVNWTGDVDTIVNINDASTTITINEHHSITANFAKEIWDWYDLHAVRDNPGGSYILMNDLDSTTSGYTELAGPTADQGEGWVPIGYGYFDPGEGYKGQGRWVGEIFDGDFHGQGYKIRDLFVNRPNEDVVGLFGCVAGVGVIEDVRVVDAAVTGRSTVGGLVGWHDGTVHNSHYTGSVTGEWRVGGLVGHLWTGAVTDSYGSGSVDGTRQVGGLVGVIDSGTVSNSYYNYDEVLVNGESIITAGALLKEDFDQWLANDKFLDVNERLSQEDDHYLINDVRDLKQLLAFGQNGSLRFRLTNDLDLAAEPDFYIPYLAGEFDGNGHKVLNLSFSFDFVAEVGLFGYVAFGGAIDQLGIENSTIMGHHCVGILAGWNNGTVSNSYSSGSVTGDSHVGGLVGINHEGTVRNSFSTGKTAGRASVGGLVGRNDGTVNNCYSSASVTGGSEVGGLVGYQAYACIVSNSYSTGSVTGDDDVGGLVGLSDEGTVLDSFWDTETSGRATSAGGTGKTTTEMMKIATFTDTATEGLDEPWDMTAVVYAETNPAYTWNIVDGETYPFLSWQSVS